jgi:hypothetical protein
LCGHQVCLSVLVSAAPSLPLAIVALKIAALQFGRDPTPGDQVRTELGETERSAQLVRVTFASVRLMVESPLAVETARIAVARRRHPGAEHPAM